MPIIADELEYEEVLQSGRRRMPIIGLLPTSSSMKEVLQSGRIQKLMKCLKLTLWFMIRVSLTLIIMFPPPPYLSEEDA